MPRVSLSPGEVFASDYEVLDRIAEGGFGSVWRVRQRSTKVERALKILNAESLLSDDARRRFQEEATVSSRIESDHLVKVIQAGVESDGTPWIVMEFLRGSTLAEHVAARGPFDLDGFCTHAQQIAHALDAAHGAGVIHRDLKPENVFLAESRHASATCTVKLLDFGIAKVRADARRTLATTAAIGTPQWMAPEQYDSKVHPTTDVWAFGLVVFYALTGATYWEGAAWLEHVDEIRRPFRDPCARALRRTGRVLPPGFDDWFARCTAPEPRMRFPSAGQAWAALVTLRSPAHALPFAPTMAAVQPPLAPSVPPAAPHHAPTQLVPPPMFHVPMQSPQTLRPVVSQVTQGPTRRAPRWPWLVAVTLVLTCVAGVALSPLAGRVREVTSSGPSPAPTHEPRTVVTAGCPEGMAYIPGGTVTLNTRDAFSVRGYCLDRVETAVHAYDACVRVGRCAAVIERAAAGRDYANVCNATRPEPQYKSHPINCVTVFEAEAYCAWRGARLPTSPEWDLAAGGRDPGRAFPWGPDLGDGRALNACGTECADRTGIALNYSGTDDHPTTAPVGAVSADVSLDGIYDLAGNISEWVAAGPWDRDPRKRTTRGGNWLFPPVSSMRRAVHQIDPGHRGRSTGFRCAADAR